MRLYSPVVGCQLRSVKNFTSPISLKIGKVPTPADGACIFTGKTAIYRGSEETWDDGKGHTFQKGVPLGVCDQTAHQLAQQFPETIVVTASTWYYQGDGCC